MDASTSYNFNILYTRLAFVNLASLIHVLLQAWERVLATTLVLLHWSQNYFLHFLTWNWLPWLSNNHQQRIFICYYYYYPYNLTFYQVLTTKEILNMHRIKGLSLIYFFFIKRKTHYFSKIQILDHKSIY